MCSNWSVPCPQIRFLDSTRFRDLTCHPRHSASLLNIIPKALSPEILLPLALLYLASPDLTFTFVCHIFISSLFIPLLLFPYYFQHYIIFLISYHVRGGDSSFMSSLGTHEAGILTLLCFSFFIYLFISPFVHFYILFFNLIILHISIHCSSSLRAFSSTRCFFRFFFSRYHCSNLPRLIFLSFITSFPLPSPFFFLVCSSPSSICSFSPYFSCLAWFMSLCLHSALFHY